jgi:hypothetical protein
MNHHKLIVCAGLLGLTVASAGPAAAQAPAAYPVATGLPPHEIVAIVRSTGLEPLSRPVRHGPSYMLHAVDPAGHPVRVVVDAKLGRIVGVVPAAHSRFGAPVYPAPLARPPANVAMVPDGYGPGARTPLAAGPGADNPYGPYAGRERLPVAPGRISTATPAETREGATPLPLPRPRPKFAAAESPPAETPPAATAPSAAKDVAPVSKSTPPAQATPAAPAIEEHE